MEGEIGVLQVEKRIRGRVKRQMEKTQREYYLNEQMKAIQKELGEGEDGRDEDRRVRREDQQDETYQGSQGKVPGRTEEAASMSPMSAEATVVRNYLDWMLGIPWKKRTAEERHQACHGGSEPTTSVWRRSRSASSSISRCRARSKKLKGPILCLVGPPGVGKTSLGKSIAQGDGP